ncbi:hypothetical protein IscW_ISCW021510 [Ixodes scapularis]|uniref:Uncharacterized protein n=1 Tax=Ixodes scapularis TaxID=6945 RepID=B7Q970_IXOSC|nr:hypothetical protein IscW_ISCW021510 [Ixodes scapularis]|eukprot:XP_002412464.1 hypothetical protein IscW_ISCW021510 [Ixodes scapularis]
MSVSPPVWGSPPNVGSMEMLLNSKDRVNTEELYQKPNPTSESLIIIGLLVGVLLVPSQREIPAAGPYVISTNKKALANKTAVPTVVFTQTRRRSHGQTRAPSTRKARHGVDDGFTFTEGPDKDTMTTIEETDVTT